MARRRKPDRSIILINKISKKLTAFKNGWIEITDNKKSYVIRLKSEFHEKIGIIEKKIIQIVTNKNL